METLNDRMREINRIAYVNPTEKLTKPPTAISIGTFQGVPIPVASYGNFTCISGPSKVGKTFFKMAMVAGYLGGGSRKYFSDIRGHGDGMVFDFDTEQSPWHVQRTIRGVREMVGESYVRNRYFGYRLREFEVNERLDFLDWTVKQKGDKIGIMVIDGIADLMRNTNDLDETNKLVQRLMRWTTVYNMHIIVVVHTNFGMQGKPTGHIGSAITKKAETVIKLGYESDADKPSPNRPFGIVTANSQYARNMRFAPLQFTVENGLPTQLENDY